MFHYNDHLILKDVDIKNDIYIIKSEISDKNSSANLYWKVINTGKSYKIIDVIVENTSYFVTKKSEFNKILFIVNNFMSATLAKNTIINFNKIFIIKNFFIFIKSLI